MSANWRAQERGEWHAVPAETALGRELLWGWALGTGSGGSAGGLSEVGCCCGVSMKDCICNLDNGLLSSNLA